MLNCKKKKKKVFIVDFIVILVAVNILFQSFGVFAVVFVCDCLLSLLTYRIVTRATGHKKPSSFVHNAQCHNFSTKEPLCITFRFPIFPLQICSSSILWGLIRWLGSPRFGKDDSLDVWEMRMLDAIHHGMRTHADWNLLNLYCTVARTWTRSLPRGCSKNLNLFSAQRMFYNIIGRAPPPLHPHFSFVSCMTSCSSSSTLCFPIWNECRDVSGLWNNSFVRPLGRTRTNST